MRGSKNDCDRFNGSSTEPLKKMDPRGTAYSSLPRRRRPSTASANGQRRQILQKRPLSSIGIRRSPVQESKKTLSTLSSSSSSPASNRRTRSTNNDAASHSPTWMDSLGSDLNPIISSKFPWNRRARNNNNTFSSSLSSSISTSSLLFGEVNAAAGFGGGRGRSSSSSSSSSMTARKRRKRSTAGGMIPPRSLSTEMSTLSNSVRQPRTTSDVVPERRKWRPGKRIPIRPKDIFWTPSKKMTVSTSYFEGSVFHSLDKWGEFVLFLFLVFFGHLELWKWMILTF